LGKLLKQKLEHPWLVGSGNERRTPKAQFALGGLFARVVPYASLKPFDFSRSRHLEAFLGAGMGFHLWH
jgi:hypothetical protein